MLVLTRLPGKGADLSRSIQALTLALAEAWALEFKSRRPPRLYGGKIRFQPEPPEFPCEEWADPFTVAERGWGDCDDLLIYRLAEILYEAGYDPSAGNRTLLPAWPQVTRALDGSGRYHVGIRHADGREEDPAVLLSRDGNVM